MEAKVLILDPEVIKIVKTAIVLGGVVLILLYLIFLAGGNEYEDHDVAELEREELFRITEELLEASEAWPVQLTAEGWRFLLDSIPTRFAPCATRWK